jgi:hypothetical protein
MELKDKPPARRKDESPTAYYRRTGHVDDRYLSKFQGRYYCNPAHCSRSFASKTERDEHLAIAYAALD